MDGSHESMAGIEVTTLPELAAAQVALNMAAAAEAAEAAAAAVLVADAQHTGTATATGTGGPSSPSASHSLINHLASAATHPHPHPHPHPQNGEPTLSFANSAADVSMADNSLSNSLSHSPDDSNASLGERSRRNQPRRTIRKACDLCHSTKVKCIMQTPLEQPSVGSNGNVVTNSGPYHRPEHPCQRCIKVGRDCVFTPLVKRKSRTSRQSYGPEVMLESNGNGWEGHPSEVEQARQARLRRAAAASSSSSSLLRQPSFPYDPVASSSSITLTPASAVTTTQALAGRSSSSSSLGSDWDIFGTLFGFDPLLASSSTSPTTLHNMPASAEEVTQFLASFEAAPWSTELQNLQKDVCVHTAEHQHQQQHPGAVAAAAPPDPSTAAADASALTEASAFFAQHSDQLLHPPPPPPAPTPTTSGHDQQHHNILTLQQHPTLHAQQPSSSSSPSLSSFHSNLAQPGWFPSPSIPTQSDHSLSTNYTQPGTQPAAPAPTTTSTSDQTAAATAAQPISSSPSSTALADPNVAQRALEVVMADTIKRIQDLLERERRARQRAEKRAGQAQGQGQGQSSLDVAVAGSSRDASGASVGPGDNTEEEEVEGLKTSVSAGLRTLALAIRVVERATAWPADMNPSTVSNGTASSGQETLTPTTTTTTNGTSMTATSGTSGEHRSGQCHSNGAGTTSSSPGYTPAFAMLLFALGMQVLQALEDLSHPLPPHLPAYPSPLRALPELAIYAPDARTLDTIRASLVREQAAQMKVCMERLVVITQARHHGGGPCITRMIAKKLGEICAQVAQA
ncbi:unnamed protein product [Tilletia caries]|uniref:Zn(2)-C6 fungal-type domain-containing protein n=1 Tax=Tilletia caries TaxID=13290 RepID=A0A177UZB3_9BASI|nr:hypothetical protein A4X03_0g4254 [Tilletia caries]CAD6897280.1 unnamed protein product [Tilletia caries]CAD6960584.1 unnamed protein product [Tilletia caries]